MKSSSVVMILSVVCVSSFFLLNGLAAIAGGSGGKGTGTLQAIDTSGEEQAQRVIGEPMVKDILTLVENKYGVTCELPKVQQSDEAIHWTCLNNMACSYKMTVSCFQKAGARTEKIKVIFSGFDSQGQNELQNVQIKHI